jgi:hypothetical protein
MAFKLGNGVHRNVVFGFRYNQKHAYAVFAAPTLALIVLPPYPYFPEIGHLA